MTKKVHGTTEELRTTNELRRILPKLDDAFI